MSLVDNGIYWIAVPLIVVAIVAGAFVTTRTPRRWWGVVVNGLIIIVATAMVVSGLFLVVNRSTSWFTSWSDLLARPGPPSIKTYGADSPTVIFGPDQPAGVQDTRTLPALPSPGQRLQQFTVPSSAGKESWPIVVTLPADYFDPASATRAYPVVLAAHGIPGSPDQYSNLIDMRQYGDQAVNQKTVHPFITVAPNITPTGQDTECIVGPDSFSQLETWLAQDIPRFITENLRAMPQREAWATLGFSAGGYCAAMVTMRHPDKFGGAVVLGGYFKPMWDGEALLTQDAAQKYDLISLASTKPPPVALFVQTSQQDQLSYPQTQQLLDAVQSPTRVHAVVMPTGGHNLGSWTVQMPDAVNWLGSEIPGFKPL